MWYTYWDRAKININHCYDGRGSVGDGDRYQRFATGKDFLRTKKVVPQGPLEKKEKTVVEELATASCLPVDEQFVKCFDTAVSLGHPCQ
jgi:hypothetical protein